MKLLNFVWIRKKLIHKQIIGIASNDTDKLNGSNGKITPPSCLKLVRIMLETWYLVRKYTHICSFRKNTF